MAMDWRQQIFLPGMLLLVAWWAARLAFGKKIADGIILQGFLNLIKFILFLPFKIAGWILAYFFKSNRP